MNNQIAAILNLVENKEALKPLTNRRPIATLPVACRYRIIDFPFSSLFYTQVRSAALFLSGSGHSLYDHIRNGSQWGLDSLVGGGVFTHSQIDLQSKELADNPYYEDHYKFLERSKADYIVLMDSKLVANVNLRSLREYFMFMNADAAVVYKEMPRHLFSKQTDACYFTFEKEIRETLTGIHSLKEQQEEDVLPVSLDIVIMKKEKFETYLKQAEKEDKLVSPAEIIRIALASNDQVLPFAHNEYARFIETIPDFFETNMDLLEEENFFSLFNRIQPIVTKVKNGAPTYFGPEAEVTASQFASDCVIEGKVHYSMIHRKTTIQKGADVGYSVLTYGAFVEEGAHLRYVILDKNVTVKKGVKLIGTRENPIVIAKNQVVSDSSDRKEEGNG